MKLSNFPRSQWLGKVVSFHAARRPGFSYSLIVIGLSDTKVKCKILTDKEDLTRWIFPHQLEVIGEN